MKLYTDAFTGTQIISDSYKFQYQYKDTIAKVKAKYIVKGEDNIDIGCGNAFGGGGQEEQAGGAPVQKVLDVVDTFLYQQTSFDQPSFQKYMKTYMKKVLGHLKTTKPERLQAFKEGAQAFFNWAKENFGELSFYTPQDYDTDNVIIMSYFVGEQPTPTFIYMMDGLKQTKL